MPVYSIGGIRMPVYSVWESHFPPDAAKEGRVVTEAIWRDMTQFAGYIAHELLEDLDDPRSPAVLSQWMTRQRADQVLREYANHPNAGRTNEFVSRPRTRFLGHGSPVAHPQPRCDAAVPSQKRPYQSNQSTTGLPRQADGP